jgi:hypothetical protein
MSFQQFDLPRIQKDFGLSIESTKSLFDTVPPVPISEGLKQFWVNIQPLGQSLNTEKARSEFLVAPLLGEVWHRSNRSVALLSGVDLSVDPDRGLNGICDFLLCQSSNLYFVTAPVLVAVEAKRDSIPDGLGQCAAEMIAAREFNVKAGKPIEPIYGCVTTGTNWKFLQLKGNVLTIDVEEYSVNQPDRILGILLISCGFIV